MAAFAMVVCFEDRTRKRFLMVRHADRGWELPGGKIQRDEDPLAAAVREFEEETHHELLEPRFVAHQGPPDRAGFVFAGFYGPLLMDADPDPQERIQESRFVRFMADVTPLSFPDDPYVGIETALGRPLRIKPQSGG